MNDSPKLAIFDLDGTIALNGVVTEAAMEGLKHLHDIGCITTLSTGRGYLRLKEILGSDFGNIISPQAIIILEHGTKLVDYDGKVVFGEFLSAEEIDHVIDFVRANSELFKLAWFNPEDVNRKVQLWCADERDVDPENEKRGNYAEIFTSSLGELKERVLKEHLTSVTFRLHDHIKVENLKLSFTRTETNVIFQDGNMEFIRNKLNKGLAVLEAAKKLGVSKTDLLVAGNAINDVEMLDIGARLSILVGLDNTRSTILSYLSNPHDVVTLDSPDALGKYLKQL